MTLELRFRRSFDVLCWSKKDRSVVKANVAKDLGGNRELARVTILKRDIFGYLGRVGLQ